LSYYPTIEDDIKRARQIVARGFPGADVYAAGKLLESLCDEVERLQGHFMTNPRLYDAAREACHSIGLPWTDPRTGITIPPPPPTSEDLP
jgi:hypothetical protein